MKAIKQDNSGVVKMEMTFDEIEQSLIDSLCESKKIELRNRITDKSIMNSEFDIIFGNKPKFSGEYDDNYLVKKFLQYYEQEKLDHASLMSRRIIRNPVFRELEIYNLAELINMETKDWIVSNE